MEVSSACSPVEGYRLVPRRAGVDLAAVRVGQGGAGEGAVNSRV